MPFDPTALPSGLFDVTAGRPRPRTLAAPHDAAASSVDGTARHAAAQIQHVAIAALDRIAPGAVSPHRVRETMFSTLPEVHAAELGVAAGLLVAVLFVTGFARLGIAATGSVAALSVAGPTELMMSTMALMHMWTEPWYFLSPFAATTAIAAAKTGAVSIRIRDRTLFLAVVLRNRVAATYDRQRSVSHRLIQHVTAQAPDRRR